MPMEQFQNILFIFFGFFLNSLAKDIYDFVSSDCAAGSSRSAYVLFKMDTLTFRIAEFTKKYSPFKKMLWFHVTV